MPFCLEFMLSFCAMPLVILKEIVYCFLMRYQPAQKLNRSTAQQLSCLTTFCIETEFNSYAKYKQSVLRSKKKNLNYMYGFTKIRTENVGFAANTI